MRKFIGKSIIVFKQAPSHAIRSKPAQEKGFALSLVLQLTPNPYSYMLNGLMILKIVINIKLFVLRSILRYAVYTMNEFQKLNVII